jgi:SAM-dependent methyltransferase
MFFRRRNRFDSGTSWSLRAELDELSAVLDGGGSRRKNLMMHASSIYGAQMALKALGGMPPRSARILDFGCGTGRMLRHFAPHVAKITGIDLTQEMLDAAARFGVPENSQVFRTDGISIPLPDEAVDLIWVSGVLKYSLFPPDAPCRHKCLIDPGTPTAPQHGERTSFSPVYRNIAAEMYRVLKPGGQVFNVEMWVDEPLDVFLPDFEAVGFRTRDVHVLRRYRGILERIVEFQDWRIPLPSRLVMALGMTCARWRYRYDNPQRSGGGFRDYLFVWDKP